MDTAIIKAVQSAGFDVYMGKTTDTWLYYTDGKRIGCLQENRLGGYGLSTVHYPNTTSGTGFQAERDCYEPLTREVLEQAFVHAPHWASGRDRDSVKKYANIDAFIKANNWNNYGLVPYASIEDVPAWKREAYAAGQYKFNPPPVTSAAWDELAWINYISHWTVKP